ncbi:MAG: hypothetical protein OEZ51_06035 [Nitrospinota bacterium]|nr:hypothetical protein [Nitrospinota bacterium]
MRFLFPKTIFLALIAVGLLTGGIPQLQAQEDFPIIPSVQESPNSFPETLPDVFEKEMVDIPPQEESTTIDASDFRDPFFFLKRNGADAMKTLTPGTTIDGLRFNTYNSSKSFINRYYKNSNFILEDVYGRIELVNQEGGCLKCHRGIEEISQNHQFSCIKCHGGNLKGQTVSEAHQGVISNPSDLKHAPEACGKCHADQIEKVSKSLMTTARGVVEITREAWGEPPLKQPKKGKNSQSLPWTYSSGDKPVDDFLQKKCLRCHVQSPSPHRPGDYRATGCASCHMVYTNEGTTLTRDRAIQKVQKADPEYLRNRLNLGAASNALNNRRGYPLLHKFTVAIPSIQCEHCHNYNGVGNEFEGLFGKPARPSISQAKVNEDQPVLYGRSHDFLLPDIHREKGMHCIDCHDQEEVKADASKYPTQHDAVQVRCETCHGTNSKAPTGIELKEGDSRSEELIKSNQLNPNLMKKIKIGDTVMTDLQGRPQPHIRLVDGKWILYSKVTGKEHKIPLLKFMKQRPYAHQILGHMKDTECSACHARWSANEWGMHVIREDDLDPTQWRDWSLSDPTLQQLLWGSKDKGSLSKPGRGMLNWTSATATPDGIKGRWTAGIWSHVFSESDWNSLILGKNKRNRYTIMKPRYQYFISTRSSANGQSSLRAQVPLTPGGKPGWVMTPHTPHTIRSTTRPCESCHENTLATGLGDPALKNIQKGEPFLKELKRSNHIQPQFQIKQMVSLNGWSLQNPMPQGNLRFLKSKEINSLLKNTDRYQAYRYLDLRREGLSRLLIRKEFPYDLQHKVNEEKFGAPTEKETLYYYDLDQKRFFETPRPEPASQPVYNENPYNPAETQTKGPESTPPPPSTGMPENPEPEFFIDLPPSITTPAPQPLPEKGFLDNANPE